VFKPLLGQQLNNVTNKTNGWFICIILFQGSFENIPICCWLTSVLIGLQCFIILFFLIATCTVLVWFLVLSCTAPLYQFLCYGALEVVVILITIIIINLLYSTANKTITDSNSDPRDISGRQHYGAVPDVLDCALSLQCPPSHDTLRHGLDTEADRRVCHTLRSGT